MISPLAYVDPSAKIGDNVTIHPFAYIDADVEIGDGCEIKPYASILRGTRMGKNNRVFQGAIVGAEPQDFRWNGEQTYCYIGNDNVIRENVIINRGIKPEGGTRIGDGIFIMAKSHIGHDCHLEGKSVVGNGVCMAGDVKIGANTILSSNSMFHENTVIGQWVLVKGGCRISGNVPPYVIIAHNPAAYFGVNAYVMHKHGFTNDEVDEIAKAYRHIYQSGTSVFNALKRVESDVEDIPARQEIIDFVHNAKLRIVGTQVELE